MQIWVFICTFFFFYACRSSTTTVTLGLSSYLISSSAETCLHVYLCPLSQISVTPCDAASELLTKSYSCRRKLDCTCFTLLYQMFQNPAQSSIAFFFDYSTAFLHFFPIRMLFWVLSLFVFPVFTVHQWTVHLQSLPFLNHFWRHWFFLCGYNFPENTSLTLLSSSCEKNLLFFPPKPNFSSLCLSTLLVLLSFIKFLT